MEFECTIITVWPQIKEAVLLLMALTSLQPKKKALHVMRLIRFSFWTRTELSITSAARKSSVLRVNICFQYFFTVFTLLLLIKVLHISIARQCRWPYDLIKVTLSDAINFVSINPPPVLSDLVILYHNCHRQESINAISVFYKFKLLINCLSWDKIWKDGATQITNHFAWPHRPIRK